MEHFIETVRKYPCLWNTTTIEYRDLELKDAAWAEVMKETELSSVKEVKLKWKKLRDCYRDALKRQSDMLTKDPNSARKAYTWKYMELMQFLQPYMNNRKKPPETYAPPPAQENGTQNGVDPSSDSSESDAESSPKRKSCERSERSVSRPDVHAKRPCPEAQYPERKRKPPPAPALPDPLDIFFNSMCQSTKRLPFPTQIKIKKTLFAAVIGAEEALVAEQQSYASLWARASRSSSSSEEEEDQKPPPPPN
ncbi:uncharacterized protein LOC106139609 [Amyelois transitella]|uniref:uncharacterized protein LOC106139609 n=1 Tax=Amyelois transitella TaxID=680683 RepID=UPI00067B23F3|nr:uncharacterized protein LOC106139609 [Amyelois transitella]